MARLVVHNTVSIYMAQYKNTLTEVEYVFYVFYQCLIEISYCIYSLPSLPFLIQSDKWNKPQAFYLRFFLKSHNFKKQYNLCWIPIMQVVVFGLITYIKTKHDISNVNDYDSP